MLTVCLFNSELVLIVLEEAHKLNPVAWVTATIQVIVVAARLEAIEFPLAHVHHSDRLYAHAYALNYDFAGARRTNHCCFGFFVVVFEDFRDSIALIKVLDLPFVCS